MANVCPAGGPHHWLITQRTDGGQVYIHHVCMKCQAEKDTAHRIDYATAAWPRMRPKNRPKDTPNP